MKRKIIWALILVILGIGGYFAYKLFGPSIKATDEGEVVYINTGEGVSSVRDKLVYNGIVNGQWFDRAAKYFKYNTAKPGRYKLMKGMSLYQLIRKLRSGNQDPVKITIVKERTKELFSGKFKRKFDTEADSLQMIKFLGNNDSLKPYGVDTNTVMALVMPYTYEVNWNTAPNKIFQQFHTAWKRYWTEENKAKATALNLTPVEVSILASIVEEETNRKDDKLNVASTYINRLKQGMRLQADPTVKFITKNFQLGRITGAHLKLESPYNTYLNAGLPPGPICTPSIASLDAVLNAPQTDYLFFVASYKFDGSTIFTSNLDDHNKYVRLFHAEQNRRADSIRKLKEIKPAP